MRETFEQIFCSMLIRNKSCQMSRHLSLLFSQLALWPSFTINLLSRHNSNEQDVLFSTCANAVVQKRNKVAPFKSVKKGNNNALASGMCTHPQYDAKFGEFGVWRYDYFWRRQAKVNWLRPLNHVKKSTRFSHCFFRFSAHRSILMASSEYFTALLGPNFREGAQNEIPLEEVDGATFKIILNFIYTGRIEINNGNIFDIIGAASHLRLTALEERCGEFWAANLSIENCV